MADPLTDVIETSAPTTLLTFSGSGFDATRVSNPAVTEVGGQYVMLFAGLPFGNNEQIGLATSPDGVTWTTNSSNPVISNADSQSWASFREFPVTLMYQNGEYEAWFNGDNSNLSTDPGYATGFGFATSPDGVNWTWSTNNPIRSALNSPNGTSINLDDVVEFGGKYVAYYTSTTPSGSVVEEATSNDGADFSADTAVDAPAGYSLLAATTTTVHGKEAIFSVWQQGSTDYYGTSIDGVNFTIDGTISLASGFDINNIIVQDGTITFFGSVGVGNVNWNFGNEDIESVTASDVNPFPYDFATAESEIATQFSTGKQLYDSGQPLNYLEDKSLVANLAADIDPGGLGTDYILNKSGYINPADLPQNFSNPDYDQCVALVLGLDPSLDNKIDDKTKNWREGQKVEEFGGFNDGMTAGDPIATFNKAGRYSGEHAGIFLGYGYEDGTPGFFMLDQYVHQWQFALDTPPLPVNQSAEIRFHSFNANAQTYFEVTPLVAHT